VTDDASPQRPEGSDSKETRRLVIAVILVALLIAFVVDNTRNVKVGFVFGDHETHLIYVLVVTFGLGVAVDRLWQRRHRHE